MMQSQRGLSASPQSAGSQPAGSSIHRQPPASCFSSAMSTPPPPASGQFGSASKDDSHNSHLAIIFGLVTAVQAIFFVVVMYKCWHERRQQQAIQNIREQSLARITEEAMDTEADAGGECDICLEGYAEGDQLGRLPCTHRFHVDCIRKWIADGVSTTCPRCRDFV